VYGCCVRAFGKTVLSWAHNSVFHPHSLLPQIWMERFPFQLLPPSLYVYLNPRLRGFSANKLSSFQVAFPFSCCFWQSVHVKLHKCFFVLGVCVDKPCELVHAPSAAARRPRLRDGATAALGCRGFAVRPSELQPCKPQLGSIPAPPPPPCVWILPIPEGSCLRLASLDQLAGLQSKPTSLRSPRTAH